MKIVPSSGEPRSAPDEDGFSSKIRRLWPEPRVKRSVLSKQICLDRFEIDGLSILDQRSEEHTSELQSLMRTSYAVFCLNKNRIHTHSDEHTYSHHLQDTTR